MNRAKPSADMLSAVLRAAPDAIIRIDRAGIIVDFLGRAVAMFGYQPGEIIGEPISRLMPDAVGKEHDGYIDAYLETGERKLPDFGRRLQAVHKDGHIFPVEIALSEMATGDALSFVGIVRDVSKRSDSEVHLAELNERLALSTTSNALGESASTMAHDLSQPLTAIANYSDALDIKLARMQGEEAKQLRALAQKSGDQARLCGEIVKRIRRTLVKQDFDPELGDFHETVRQSVESVSKGFGTHGVELLVKRSGDTGAAYFDRIQLHQVIANLLSNALTAVKGADTKRIIVESIISDGHARLRITDTGSGVPDVRKREIFEAFVGDGLSGLGLGLAVAKRIATAHSGEISVEDGVGCGTIFTFSFPINSAS